MDPTKRLDELMGDGSENTNESHVNQLAQDLEKEMMGLSNPTQNIARPTLRTIPNLTPQSTSLQPGVGPPPNLVQPNLGIPQARPPGGPPNDINKQNVVQLRYLFSQFKKNELSEANLLIELNKSFPKNAKEILEKMKQQKDAPVQQPVAPGTVPGRPVQGVRPNQPTGNISVKMGAMKNLPAPSSAIINLTGSSSTIIDITDGPSHKFIPRSGQMTTVGTTQDPSKAPPKHITIEDNKTVTAPNANVLKELNDVTKIAGVNLKEETGFLPQGSGPESSSRVYYPDDVKTTVINMNPLRGKVQEVAKKHSLKAVQPEVYEFLSLAVQVRLRNIIDQLIEVSRQRADERRSQFPVLMTSDPRRQLMLIEKREQEEKEKKDVEEKERLLKRGESKDEKQTPEMRLKMNQARLEEEERMRTNSANKTALQAIPDRPRQRPNTNSGFMAPGQQQGGQGRGAGGAGRGQSGFTMQHLTALQQLQGLIKAGQKLDANQQRQYEQLQMALQQLKQQQARTKQAGGAGRGAPGANGSDVARKSRSITLKDLDFWFCKDPFIRRSKVTYKCLDARRRKLQR